MSALLIAGLCFFFYSLGRRNMAVSELRETAVRAGSARRVLLNVFQSRRGGSTILLPRVLLFRDIPEINMI